MFATVVSGKNTLCLHVLASDDMELLAQQLQDREGAPPGVDRLRKLYYSLPLDAVSKPKVEPTHQFNAAGVLPYTVSQGQLLFLLGKSPYYSKAPIAKDSSSSSADVANPANAAANANMRKRLVWSGFGGSRDEKELEPEYTAAREFAEETIGLFADISCSPAAVEQSRQTMLQLLLSKEARNKTVFAMRNNSYLEFVAPVTHIEPFMFKLALSAVRSESDSRSCVRTEKQEFLFVPAATILDGLRAAEETKAPAEVFVDLRDRQLHLFYKFVFTLRFGKFAEIVSSLCHELKCSPGISTFVPKPAPRSARKRQRHHLQEPEAVSSSSSSSSSPSSSSSSSAASDDNDSVPLVKRAKADPLTADLEMKVAASSSASSNNSNVTSAFAAASFASAAANSTFDFASSSSLNNAALTFSPPAASTLQPVSWMMDVA